MASGLSRRDVLTAGVLSAISGCQGVTSPPSRETEGFAGEGAPEVRVGFVGDLMLGRGVDATHRNQPPTELWGDVLPWLEDLDGVVGNLECCLSNRGRPRPGRTYQFRASPDWAVPALLEGNVAGVSLANNHVLDYGLEAFQDTQQHLDDAFIKHAGAGESLRAAIQPVEVTLGELSIAMIGLTDQAPGYAAGPNQPGTAFAQIGLTRTARPLMHAAVTKAVRLNPDLVVASLHWGPNWVTRPADRYQGFAHWLIDHGVDVVHGHSAHVVQGVELYDGCPILHDTGDFVDDYAVKSELRNDRSFLFELGLTKTGVVSVRLRPVEIVNRRVTQAEPAAAEWLRDVMRERSAGFGTEFTREGLDLVVTGRA